MPVDQTSPPGRYIVLYDGLCKFCQASMRKLMLLVRPGTLVPVSFQDPGALDPFPGITHDDCMRQMHLVTPAGRVYRGFEAAVQAVATRPILGWFAYGYYLPGIHFVLDRFYAWLARRRYRLMGKLPAQDCPEGTCKLHARLQAQPGATDNVR